MTTRSLFRKLFESRTFCKPPARCRPALETLEDRFAPATLGMYSVVEGPTVGIDAVVLGNTGAWTATSNSSFLHVTTGSTSGTGNALIKYSFDANTGATRTGTFTIAGLTLTVTQAGSTYVAARPLTTLVSSGLSGPMAVAVDPSGNVDISDTGNSLLKQWNATTQQVSPLSTGQTNQQNNYFALDGPVGVAADAQGNVLVADKFNHSIDMWNTGQQLFQLIQGENEFDFPEGLAIDSANHVYYSHEVNGSPWQIDEFYYTLGGVEYINTPVSSGLSQPWGLAVDAAGNLYIADTGNNAIKEWNASTATVSTLVSGLNGPFGVAVDGSGNVYIADSGNNAIKEWNASTATVSTLVSTGLNHPEGVAVDAAGDVYIADSGNGAIKELTRAFVPAAAVTEGAAAGSASLLPVLPTSQLLTGVFAPTSNQSWLTVGTSANGVVNFSFTQNTTGAARVADLTVLGQQVAVQQNAPPTLTIGTNQTAVTGNEGSPIANTGTFADAHGLTTVSLAASLGTVTENTTTGTWSWSYTPPRGTGGAIPVTITATDTAGQKATTTFNLTANLVAPTITTFSVPTTGKEGSAVALTGAATLPAAVTDTISYTWTVLSPFGTTSTLTGANASYTPPDEGTFGVELTVTDSEGVSSSARLPSGLISWYPAEGNANDYFGANNGQISGGVSFVQGKVGQAFSFNGTTGTVSLPNNFLPYPTSGTSNTPLSFETWFRTTSGGVILGQVGATGGYVPAVYVGTDGKLRAELFWGGSANPITSTAVVNDGQWHHVAVAYNGSTETVYLDGTSIGSTALTQTAYNTSYQYMLGAAPTSGWPGAPSGTYYFGGQIDDPAFYNRALSATDIQTIISQGKIATVTVAIVPPTPALAGYTTVLATEVVNHVVSATSPSPTDQAAGFNYTINWGDGTTPNAISRTAGNGSGVSVSHVLTTAGSYTGSVVAVDDGGGTGTIAPAFTALAVTSANLQTIINQQGSIACLETTAAQAQALVNAVNGLAAQTKAVTITMELGSGTFTDTSGSPHAGITLVITGSGGTTTIVGHSPALEVSGGNVIVENLTLVTDTDSPTLVISGGTVTLRNVDIESSSTGSQAALDITGGNVDLGDANDLGGNTFNDNGTGQLISNTGPNGVSAVGDTWEVSGTPLTNPYRIKDQIFDALNAGGGGLVTYVPGNDYVSMNGGVIQLGVNAIAPGGTVNVEQGGKYKDYDAGSKLVTVAYQNGPTLSQQVSPFDASLLDLIVTGTNNGNHIQLTSGGQEIQAQVNDVPNGRFAPTGRLVAYGGAGNDNIQVDGGITLSAWLFAGTGNTMLQGGGGNDVLVGGGGNDTLIGGKGSDLMIAGSGASQLIGNSGNDLMIAGTTAFDNNEAALNAIMAEWTSGRSYAERMANLSGTGTGGANGDVFLIASGPGETVFGNGYVNSLQGGSGMNWYFAKVTGNAVDIIRALHDSEIVEDLGLEAVVRYPVACLSRFSRGVAWAARTRARDNLRGEVHVFDHFHVVKLYNEKLTHFRRELVHELTAAGQKLLKGVCWLLLKIRQSGSEGGETEANRSSLRLWGKRYRWPI